MAEFKVIEEGAFGDYEFEARAGSKEELFAICGVASFDAIANVAGIKPEKTVEFEISAENDEDLLYTFLSELIYIKDVENLLLCMFEVVMTGEFKLRCKAFGETIDPLKHELKTDVKAVTYHKLSFEKLPDGYAAHVILDL